MQKKQGRMAGKYFLQQREMSVEAQRYQWTEDHQRNFRQKKVEMTGKLEVRPSPPKIATCPTN